MEERTLDGEKENYRGGVNADFHENKSGHGRECEVVSRAKLRDEMDDQFLNQVRAVGDAGDEGGAGNCNSTKRQSRTDGADQKHCHAKSDERKLPDRGRDTEIISFAEIKAKSDRG